MGYLYFGFLLVANVGLVICWSIYGRRDATGWCQGSAVLAGLNIYQLATAKSNRVQQEDNRVRAIDHDFYQNVKRDRAAGGTSWWNAIVNCSSISFIQLCNLSNYSI